MTQAKMSADRFDKGLRVLAVEIEDVCLDSDEQPNATKIIGPLRKRLLPLLEAAENHVNAMQVTNTATTYDALRKELSQWQK